MNSVWKFLALQLALASVAVLADFSDFDDGNGFGSVFSNSNVNLGNLANLEGSGHDLGPKLTGPNVCTKQEP